MAITHPVAETIEVKLPALGATTDDVVAATVAPFAGVVESVQYIPDASMTGDATNNRTLTITNKGQAGAGTTTVAQLAFAASVNATAFDAKTITMHATAANHAIVEGDVLAYDSTHGGTGIADPGGLLRIVVRRDGASYPSS